MILNEQTVTVHCDGPDCAETASVSNPQELPAGWIETMGPTQMPGQIKFEFHSGACYDAWKVNVNTFLATLAAEAAAAGGGA